MTQSIRSSPAFFAAGRRTWDIAVYIRLSREDARSPAESESDANQRAIIEEHIAAFDDGDEYRIAGEYVDDGISGTTDDGRDGFQRMLSDILRGRINCVIVKDLARSFRNYSDQGYYLDDWFPRHGVRFISLYHQPLDSYKEPRGMRNIAVPIQGVLNENHCAETSDKVREVFDMKRRNGEHIGSFAVYGYIKAPGNKNALVIDREAAAVVRDIFSMFLNGMSKNAIVRSLNGCGILSPSAYKKERLGLKYQNPRVDPAKPSLWCPASVTAILKNRMYCGDMVQGRCRMKSYKIHIQEAVPQEEWYVVENTHEPIISRDTFQKTQKLLSMNIRTGPGQNQPYLFSGLLKCADCGRAMTRSKAGNAVYYYCRTYKDCSKNACTKHTIRHDRLETAVLFAVRLQIYLAAGCTKLLEQAGRSAPSSHRTETLTEALNQKERELSKIARYKQAIYQDWKDGEITRDDYRQMKEDYERQAKELSGAVERLRSEIEKPEAREDTENQLFSSLQRSQNIDSLTRDILLELVDQIIIREGGRITIVFRFSDGLSAQKTS